MYTNKTENFEENEVIGFLESMSSTKFVKLDNFKLELMNIYYIKTGRNFNVDFPKVDAFVSEKMVVTTVKNPKPVCRWIKPKSEGENDDLNYTKRMEWLWSQLCSKFNKMENFTQDEINCFVEDLCKRGYGFTSLNNMVEDLAFIYSGETNENFDDNFPDVQDRLNSYSEVDAIRIQKRKETQKMSRDKLWKSLRDFTNKTDDEDDNFSEDQMMQFFEMQSKSESPTILYKQMNNLADIYYHKLDRDFYEDFPKGTD